VASIHIIQGADKGRILELHDGENVIGRIDCDVTIADGTVSREHAKLTKANGKWMLEDLGSANGTFLNGSRLTAAAGVKGGDQIRIGTTLLVFSGASGPAGGGVEVDRNGNLVDAAIVATVPSNEDSVIIPTPEAGAQAIDSLRFLYDLISEVGSIFNIDLLMQRTLDRIFEALPADRGYVMLADTHGKMKVRASRLSDKAKGMALPVSKTIIKEVVNNQVGVLSTNAMNDKRFAKGKSVQNFGIHSAMCVPIKGREKILGFIHIDCSVSDHTYTTEQLRLLTAIGYQTGLAVENVRLYESNVQSERLAAVGETVAFLSHGIKNILQAMGAGVEVVTAGLKAKDLDKVQNAWPVVQRNVDRINGLILNMLAFSKKREPVLESVNLREVLGECIQAASAAADERGVAIISDLEEVPPIPADGAGLQQAFANLINNALDAVADTTGAITVACAFDRIDRQAVVRIIDNGTGIPADKLDEIFTPFYSSKGQKGTGLGLAVAQKIVSEHHGKIEVASTVGEGTTFTITLPSAQPDAAASDDTDVHRALQKK